MILKIKLLYFLIKLTVDFAASGSLRVTPSPVAAAADGDFRQRSTRSNKNGEQQ